MILISSFSFPAFLSVDSESFWLPFNFSVNFSLSPASCSITFLRMDLSSCAWRTRNLEGVCLLPSWRTSRTASRACTGTRARRLWPMPWMRSSPRFSRSRWSVWFCRWSPFAILWYWSHCVSSPSSSFTFYLVSRTSTPTTRMLTSSLRCVERFRLSRRWWCRTSVHSSHFSLSYFSSLMCHFLTFDCI